MSLSCQIAIVTKEKIIAKMQKDVLRPDLTKKILNVILVIQHFRSLSRALTLYFSYT